MHYPLFVFLLPALFYDAAAAAAAAAARVHGSRTGAQRRTGVVVIFSCFSFSFFFGPGKTDRGRVTKIKPDADQNAYLKLTVVVLPLSKETSWHATFRSAVLAAHTRTVSPLTPATSTESAAAEATALLKRSVEWVTYL
jgi:hypothetical protein